MINEHVLTWSHEKRKKKKEINQVLWNSIPFKLLSTPLHESNFLNPIPLLYDCYHVRLEWIGSYQLLDLGRERELEIIVLSYVWYVIMSMWHAHLACGKLGKETKNRFATKETEKRKNPSIAKSANTV